MFNLIMFRLVVPGFEIFTCSARCCSMKMRMSNLKRKDAEGGVECWIFLYDDRVPGEYCYFTGRFSFARSSLVGRATSGGPKDVDSAGVRMCRKRDMKMYQGIRVIQEDSQDMGSMGLVMVVDV